MIRSCFNCLFLEFVALHLVGCRDSKKDVLPVESPSVQYEADTETVFPNPERGWFTQYVNECCDIPPTSCELPPTKIEGPHEPLASLPTPIRRLRALPERITLVKSVVKIQQYSGDIPQARLDEIKADFDAVRAAGAKVIWRVSYNTSINTGEPCMEVINRHYDQLLSIVLENIDIIFSFGLGTFGGSREACCQSFWIKSYDTFSSLVPGLKALYNKLINAISTTRNVTLRYPIYKYQLLDWTANDLPKDLPAYPSAAKPLTAANAFDGSKQARIGFVQDNFAGDIDGYGFTLAWEAPDRNFVEQDTKFALITGELSAFTDYNRDNGFAELQKYHFSAFHATKTDGYPYEGWDELSAVWKSKGQYTEIGKKLGYRFRLVSGKFQPKPLTKDSLLRVTLKVANDGWARIMNPRKVEIILREKTTGEKYTVEFDGDGRGNRLWLPGPGEEKELAISKPLPTTIKLGSYDLLLNLADPYPKLHDRPDYSIRVANNNIWEAETGYNKLLQSITIQ